MKPFSNSNELKIINLSNDNPVLHKSNIKSKKKKLFLVNRERKGKAKEKEKKGKVDENEKNNTSYLDIINLRSIKNEHNYDNFNNKYSNISEESVKSHSNSNEKKDNKETITERKTFKEIVNDIEFIHYKKEEDLKSQVNNINGTNTSNNNDKNMYNPKQNTPFYQIISKNFSYFLMNNKKKNNFQLNTILNTNQRLKEEQRKSILMREGVTHIIDNNKKRLVNPSFNYTYDKVFNNLSEKNRCEKYTQILSNLKEIILKDEKNEKQIVKEVSILFNYQ